jgi:hypothetical protein
MSGTELGMMFEFGCSTYHRSRFMGIGAALHDLLGLSLLQSDAIT